MSAKYMVYECTATARCMIIGASLHAPGAVNSGLNVATLATAKMSTITLGHVKLKAANIDSV